MELEFESKLEELGLQLQMFSKAPTKQAWDIINELYVCPEVQFDPDFARNKEKINMFFSAVLANHPDWAITEDQKLLLSTAKVRREWLLSESGDSQRKLDHIWYAYFATGDKEFPLKIGQVADNLTYPNALREVAVRTYYMIASTTYPELETICPAVYKIGEHIEKKRLSLS